MKFLKAIKWSVESILLGLGILFVFNLIGVYINVNIPINVYTLFIAGVFKVPGISVLIIFYLL